MCKSRDDLPHWCVHFTEPAKGMKLEWKSRFNIALGTAQGLAHLHTKMEAHLVHSDIKAINILLDKNLSPKIADLGLARLFQRDADKLHTFVAGARYKKNFPWFKRIDPWLSPHSVFIQPWAPLSGFKDLMGIIPSYLFCCKFGAAFLACVCIEQCLGGGINCTGIGSFLKISYQPDTY